MPELSCQDKARQIVNELVEAAAAKTEKELDKRIEINPNVNITASLMQVIQFQAMRQATTVKILEMLEEIESLRDTNSTLESEISQMIAGENW